MDISILSKITLPRGMAISAIVICLIAPPAWFLYDFERALFLNLDYVRLFLIILMLGTNGFIVGFATWFIAFVIILANKDFASLKNKKRREPG